VATDLICEFMPGAGPFDLATESYLQVPSAVGAAASTPDTAALDITGDLHIRAEITLEDWTPPTNSHICGKYIATGNQRSWWFFLDDNTGFLSFQWSEDGVIPKLRTSTVALPSSSGRLAVGVKMDVSNGGNHVVTFETAPAIDGTWTDLSAVTTAGVTSIFASTAFLDVGNVSNHTATGMGGRIHAVEVRSGILGSVVANPDFTVQAAGDTSFVDAAGRTWTIHAPAEIIGFTWADLSSRLLTASWSTGRENELEQFGPAEAVITLKNEDRELDPEYTAGGWFGLLRPRTPVRIQSVTTAVDLPGAFAAVDTPDATALAITGDLDVRARLALDDWTPAAATVIVSQWSTPSNEAWQFGVTTGGNLNFTFTTNGSTDQSRSSTVATGFTNGTDHWVRATIDVSSGGNHVVTFYTSEDGIIWDVLGTAVTTAGTVTLFNSTSTLRIGALTAGGGDLNGQIRYVELRSGIDGTVVANPEFYALDVGTAAFTDRAGRDWTVVGIASVVLDSAVRTDQFYGFVEDGWQQQYGHPGTAVCELKLVDMLGVVNGALLPITAYEVEILDDNPTVFWNLNEENGDQMGDSSPNELHGRLDNGVMGEDPLIFSGKSFLVPHVGDNRGYWSGESLPTTAPVTLEAWIKTERDLTQTKSIIVAQRDSTLGSALWLEIQTSGGGSPNGELVINFRGLGTFYMARGDTPVDDGNAHHVVMTASATTSNAIKLYVDGEEETKTTISGTNGGSWAGHFIWTVGNTVDNGSGDFGLGGHIDEVAVYPQVLSADRITAHYQAGLGAWDGDASGERINRVLDIIGVPDELRDIATGDTFVGPADYGGQNAGTYLASVVESEQGFFYVNHRNGGKLTFRGRYSRLTETRSTSSIWTFTDQDGTGNLHYERDDLVIDPNGIQSIVNVVGVDWRGGSVQVQDDDSVGAYGPQVRSIRTEAASPQAAKSTGEWLINRYGQPQVRIRGFRLEPSADTHLWMPVLEAGVSDRITTVRQPRQIGTATTNELYVEGFSHSVDRGVHWTTAIHASAADLGAVWIWDVDTWDETTVWG
jgi:hypothetical protein